MMVMLIGDNEESNFKKPEKNQSEWEVDTFVEKTRTMHDEDTRDSESKFETSMANVAVPELERRIGHNPLMVPVNPDLNTDIYFIGNGIRSIESSSLRKVSISRFV